MFSLPSSLSFLSSSLKHQIKNTQNRTPSSLPYPAVAASPSEGRCRRFTIGRSIRCRGYLLPPVLLVSNRRRRNPPSPPSKSSGLPSSVPMHVASSFRRRPPPWLLVKGTRLDDD
ncbi:hypothetical protein LINPERHAP1_LOCUS1638 [Linum perenne]